MSLFGEIRHDLGRVRQIARVMSTHGFTPTMRRIAALSACMSRTMPAVAARTISSSVGSAATTPSPGSVIPPYDATGLIWMNSMGGSRSGSRAISHTGQMMKRTAWNTAAKTVVDNFMKANPKAKRWHLLVADYAFGWSLEKYIKEVGKNHGLEFVGADRHPLGEREFSNYVQKAAANRHACLQEAAPRGIHLAGNVELARHDHGLVELGILRTL